MPYSDPLHIIHIHLNQEINMSALTYARWTKDEDRLVRKYYGKLSCPEMSRVIGRSLGGIRNRVSRLHLPGTMAQFKTAKKSLKSRY